MKISLTKYFWISLIVLIVLFIAPLLFIYDEQFVDGQMIMEFPLTAYSYGGWCIESNSCTRFFPLSFIIVVLMIFGISLMINYTASKVVNK